MEGTLTYTDSHCHLNSLKLNEAQLEKVIADARNRNVANMLSVCTRFDEANQILALTQKHHNIWSSVGVHPLELEADTANIQVEQFSQYIKHKKTVAIGETGLDFHYSAETKKQQIDAFATHLEVGKIEKLPVIVHTRKAKKETIDLLRNHACDQSVGVMHCFTEDIEMAKQALDIGFYISFSGIVTFKNADELRGVAKYVPEDRILVETDAPYLAPVPHRGKPNEPKFVVDVCDFVADLRNTSKEAFAKLTTQNFFNLFIKASL